MAAMIAISLYRELPRAAFEAQRQKEELLIERGEQYKRAIQVFYRKFNRYPATIEQLENTNNIRFLRKRFKDPITGKDEWRLVHAGPGGFTDSLTQAPQKKEGQPGTSVQDLAQQQQQGGDEPRRARLITRRRQSESGFPIQQAPPGEADSPPAEVPPPGQDPQQQPAQYPGQQPPPSNVQPGQVGYPQPQPVYVQQPGQPPSLQQQPGQPGVQPGTFPPGQPSQPVIVQQPVLPWQRNQQPGQPAPFGQPIGQPIGQPVLPPGAQPGQAQPFQPGQVTGGMQQPYVPGQAAPAGQQPYPYQQPQPYQQQQQYPSYRQPAPVYQMPPGQYGQQAPRLQPVPQQILEQLQNPRQGGLGGFNQPGQGMQMGGGGIAGVASKSEEEGIKIYNDRSKYKEWEFIYDPRKDLSTAVGQQNARMQQSQPNPNLNQSLNPSQSNQSGGRDPIFNPSNPGSGPRTR